ncbi:MAG: N-acetyltransferase [Candidatus Cloacimonetes bacterium]|nr:N-acetyltransferase [Candidatus Cloacimonadota bacterium]
MNQYIAKSAKIGDNSQTGINSIVLDNVTIGENCQIGHHVIIYEGTVIGNNVRIDDNTIIGKKPMHSPRSIFKEEKDYRPARIGDGCLIGANVIIYVQAEMGENNLIADLATIRENTEIGDFNIIGRNVTIENFVKIGSRNKIETNSYITAYSELGDYCFIAPCVATSNDNYMGRDKERFHHFKGVTVKSGGRIGVNATILPGKTIEEDGVVSGGAVLTKDLPAQEIWVGNPAKYFKEVDKKQLKKNNLDEEKK